MKRVKKHIAVLLAVVLVLALEPLPAFAQAGADNLTAGEIATDTTLAPDTTPTTDTTPATDTTPTTDDNLAAGALATQATVVASGPSGSCTWSLDSDGVLTIQPESGRTEGTLDTWLSTTDAPWYNYREQIKTVAFEGGTVHAKTCIGFFYGCSSLTSITNLGNLETSSATDMSSMFKNCSQLGSLDLSNFDASHVINMYEMFYGCSSLTSLNLTGFNTSSAATMSAMFQGCGQLGSLDVSSFTTTGVTNMSYMFNGCSSLSELDLSRFDTSSVNGYGMYCMFMNCSSLTSLNVSNFDTSHVSSMTNMFYNCTALISLDLSSFDTGSLTDFLDISACRNLRSLSLGANTRKVTGIPETEINGRTDWYSEVDGVWYTSAQILESRLGTADTYTKKASIASATASLDPQSFVYDGSSHEPTLTLTLDGIDLLKGTDYEITSYENNVNAGTASINVTGIGDFTGTKKVEFTINKAPSAFTAAVQTDSVSCNYNAAGDVTINGSIIAVSGNAGAVQYSKNTGSAFNVDASTGDVTVPAGTALGTYGVKVKVTDPGDNNHEGKSYDVEYSVVVTKASIAEATVTLSADTYTYTGEALTPQPTVTLYGANLTSDDYDVSYSNNVDIGTATVTVTGKGNYKDEASTTFEIAQASVSDAVVELSQDEFIYDGRAQRPGVTVRLVAEGDPLVSGTDYDVTYLNNVNAGTAMVKITGKGDFVGEKSVQFTIQPARIEPFHVDYPQGTVLYTGQPREPEVVVRSEDGSKTLVSGTDYDVEYANNVNIGYATVTVTGKGNYAGELPSGFEIVQANIGSATITLSPIGYAYDGTQKTPTINATFEGNRLTEGTDFDAAWDPGRTAIGNYKVTLTGKGGFTGTTTASFNITQGKVKSIEMAGLIHTYDGTVKAPVTAVRGEYGETLRVNVDYTLSYKDASGKPIAASAVKDAGMYTVIATGNGIYAGSNEEAQFLIKKASLSEAIVELSQTSYTYDSYAKTPTTTVRVAAGATPLVYGKDYTATYTGNVNAGAASVTVTGMGNYQDDAKQARFTISQASMSGAAVSGVSNRAYNGSAQTQSPTVYVGSRQLRKDTDYTLSYKNNVNAGTATMTVTGKGNYKGSSSRTFTISAASLSGASVTGVTDRTYNGSAQTQSPTVKVDGKTLKNGTDYTLSYLGNVNVGTATMTVTGKGNYTGSKTVAFKINAAPTPTPTPDPTPTPSPVAVNGHVNYRTHVQNVGWQGYVSDGAMSGTSGRSLRLEGININADFEGVSGGIEYRTHIQNIGWESGWKRNGEMSGTSGRALRLEAIQIQLTGEAAAKFDVYYRVHCQNFGWMGWAKNGAQAGSAGYAYRLEGIEVRLVPKGGSAPGSTSAAFRSKSGGAQSGVPDSESKVLYRTHVQNDGWQNWMRDGEMAGTQGRSLRLEGINIKLGGAVSGGIEYRTHIQNIGWQEFKSNGDMSGTSGRSLRLEAIEIRLTGEATDKYDVYYRVHAQNFGWMGWAKNGERAGTAGYAYRLEGINIQLVPKGGSAPGSTSNAFRQR